MGGTKYHPWGWWGSGTDKGVWQQPEESLLVMFADSPPQCVSLLPDRWKSADTPNVWLENCMEATFRTIALRMGCLVNDYRTMSSGSIPRKHSYLMDLAERKLHLQDPTIIQWSCWVCSKECDICLFQEEKINIWGLLWQMCGMCCG